MNYFNVSHCNAYKAHASFTKIEITVALVDLVMNPAFEMNLDFFVVNLDS